MNLDGFRGEGTVDTARREERLKTYLMETTLGLLVAAGLLFAGHMAVKLVNADVDIMIEKTRWTQDISGTH